MDKKKSAVGRLEFNSVSKYLTLLSILWVGSLSYVAVSFSDDDETTVQQALQQTQQVLRDARLRQEAVQKDPKARQADENARKVAGSEQNLNAMYDLSADVMETVNKESGGDPVKMQKLLDEASKNPEAFVHRFTPEQKEKLKAIADKTIEAQKK